MSPEEKEVIEETEQIEQEKEVIEESQEDTETTDVVEKDDSESTQETQEDSDDGYEAEVLQQYGLKHKSVKELAEEYKKREAEFEAVRRENDFNKQFLTKKETAQEERADAPFGIAPAKKTEQKIGAFPEKPANSYLDQLRQSGRITPEQYKEYGGVATIIDDSVAPLFEQTQQFMYQAATVITKLQKKLQDMTWGTFNHPQKEKVQRDLLDKLMAAQGFDNYEDAMNFYILKTNPSLLSQVADKAKEEGKKEGFKTLKRLITNRRGAPAPTMRIEKYLDKFGNVDEERLLADFKGDRLKVAAFLDKNAK